MATNTETCVYKDRFDPAQFYTEYYIKNNNRIEYCIKFFYDLYTSDKFQGNTFLDLCCGPTMHWLAAPSLKFSDITMGDLLNSNLVEVNRWLQKDPNAIDWTPTFNWAANAEGISDHTIIEDRVRKAVKHVVLCDILQENPLLNITKQFDAVQCIFGVDSSTHDPDSLKIIIKNISNLVKPGGALVMLNVYGGTYYKIGPHTFPKIYMTKETLKDALVGAGFEDIKIVELIRPDICQRASDSKGMLISVAFKNA